MTKEEAISHLRWYRRYACTHSYCNSYSCQKNRLKSCAYRDFLISVLIRQISENIYKDPIKIVMDAYYQLDYLLGESDEDHFESHAFISQMEQQAGYILRSLQEKEKRLNEVYKLETGY